MSKKKNNDSMNTEKALAKLMEEIKKKDFKSTDELNDFMNNFIGQSLDDLPERTDKKVRSIDLVFEAYEQPVSKGKNWLNRLLNLTQTMLMHIII